MIVRLLIAMIFAVGAFAQDRWWPTQAVPKQIMRAHGPASVAEQMLAQSIAGLAAKSVNDSTGEEMVWINTGGGDQEEWFRRWRAVHTNVTIVGPFAPWDLVDRYAKRGLIKGYVLYRADNSAGALNDHRPSMDRSVNVATSLAGILDAVIVEEKIEGEAKARGLKLLVDARDKTQSWCFDTYRDQFNRRMVCAQDPKKPHTRDFAIAQKAFTFYGADAPTEKVMAWLDPLSPVLGWNGGDEFQTTMLSTRYGHIQTATDWCMNLPVLMAGSDKITPSKAPEFDPKTIDWTDRRSAVSFVQSDGDNVQWLQGNFFRHPNYWASPDRGKIPFGWSTCFTHLTQLSPSAIDYATETRRTNDSLLEWGGGYYYPDGFAKERANRWDLLAQHARRTWALMKRTNARIIGFNVEKHDSPDARKAYEVIAREMDGLLGILIFQYYPYEGGVGTTFWVKDKNGSDVPVVTARYSLWENQRRVRTGTPAKIAREIRESVEKSGSKPRYDWVITHSWSYFTKAQGTDERAEDMPQNAPGGVRGYTPVIWCAERLPENIRVVTPEELLWRIRVQRNPGSLPQ